MCPLPHRYLLALLLLGANSAAASSAVRAGDLALEGFRPELTLAVPRAGTERTAALTTSEGAVRRGSPREAAHIRLVRRHGLGVEEARRATDRLIAELRTAHGIQIEAEWRGSVLHARGPGFEGTLRVDSEEIEVSLRLGLLLSPIRGRLMREAEAFLDRYVGPDGVV
jgi:putative polyhydroxyalkanoate system protein